MKRWTVLAAGVTGLLALTGCSNATGGSGSDDSKIVIGTLGAYSGASASSQGGAGTALEAWASWVNEQGGIDGKTVEVVSKDLGSNLSGGLAAVRELIERDGAVAIVGPQDPGDGTWASYAASRNVPVVGGFPQTLPQVTDPNFFPAGMNFAATAWGIVEAAKSQGNSIGVLYCAESPVCASSVALYSGFAEAQGVDVAVSAKVSQSGADYTGVCQQIKESGADSFVTLAQSSTVVQIAEACANQGVKSITLGSDGSVSPSWVDSAALEGTVAVLSAPVVTNESVPGMQDFHKAMNEFAPKLGDLENQYAVQAWVAGTLLQRAIEGSGSDEVTAASIKEGLYSLKDETLDGLIPPVTYVEGEPTVNNCYVIARIEGGAFTEPDGVTPKCAPDEAVAAVLDSL